MPLPSPPPVHRRPPTAHRPLPPNFRNCLLLPDPLHIILLKLRAILFASFWGYPLHSARSVMATGGNFRPVGRIGCGALPDVWPVKLGGSRGGLATNFCDATGLFP